MSAEIPDYGYHVAGPGFAHSYIWPELRRTLASWRPPSGTQPAYRALDLGCGAGATTDLLHRLGFLATGVDPSESGIALAGRTFKDCHFEVASASDDLAERIGQFDLVVSLEVIEHTYDPASFATALFQLTKSGGTAIVTTPYHGYLKNVAIALMGKHDFHFNPLWHGGHIKFFSIATLRALLQEVGFREIEFKRMGRFPSIAKSMMAIARK